MKIRFHEGYCSHQRVVPKIKTLWPESMSKLCHPSNRHLLERLVPTFADTGCHVVSAADPLCP